MTVRGSGAACVGRAPGRLVACSQRGRVPVPVLLGAVVLIGGAVALLPMLRLGQLQQQVSSQRQQLDSLTTQNAQFQQQLVAAENERKALESRLAGVRTQLAEATEEVAKSHDAQSRYDLLKDEHGRLELQLTQALEERDHAKEQMMRLEEDKSQMERAAAKARNRLALLEREYQEAIEQLSHAKQADAGAVSVASTGTGMASQRGASPTSSVSPAMGTPPTISSLQTIELPPIVVRKEAGRSLAAPIRGRLIDVNPAHRFIVIDQGDSGGVWVGMPFDILRGDRRIGQAVAVRVRSQITACDLMVSHEPPTIGDLVVQRGP